MKQLLEAAETRQDQIPVMDLKGISSFRISCPTKHTPILMIYNNVGQMGIRTVNQCCSGEQLAD